LEEKTTFIWPKQIIHFGHLFFKATLIVETMSDNKKILINGYKHIPYRQVAGYSGDEMHQHSKSFYEWLNARRSVRMFSDKPVPKTVIENLILSASTAPSGANKQPWTFCAVSNPQLKTKIREAAEEKEKLFYEERAGVKWKSDLESLGTDTQKPFLETAPWLIIVFRKNFDFDKIGKKSGNYYANESVGIACGMLITAIHHLGLVTVPYTPNPMNFLAELLGRPSNERAFILFPVGFAHENALVPDISRKSLDEVGVFYE
jgi:nitroreductase